MNSSSSRNQEFEMDLEIRRFDSDVLSKSFPRSANRTFSGEETPDKYGHLQITDSSKEPVVTKNKPGLVELVLRDDKQQLVAESKLIDLTIDQSIVPKLLVLCCAFDSVECAASILHGDLGEVPLLNSTDEQGKSPLHTAAEQHSARCVELLPRKRSRTDIRTKDGRAQLPLELSLSSWRMEVIWNPDEHSIEDLIAVLGQKDLTAIKLLSAKTKAIDDVAYACAMGGRIVALASLLMVAAKEVNESILVLHDAQSGLKEETTVYECVIREALALGCTMTSSSVSSLKRNCSRTARTKSETAEKRKVLVCEIELLQLFGAVAQGGLTDKRVASPLILAVQAGDGDIVELILKTSIDVNDADAEGNSALHWCLKSSKASCLPQKRILWLLLKHGARVSQKNKLGLTALHVAAEKGNTEALQILLLEEPDCINYKSEMKETSLFYAVKNDHLVCTEILLLCGAERDVFNLRKQRPIDLAVSQDMRFILSPANIRHMNRVFPVQKKCNALLASDEVISDSCEKLIATVVKGTNVDRRDKCVFDNGEEELQQTMRGHVIHASSAMKQQRKIFVGGLPPSLDSDSLAKLFEEKFGSVENAVVMEDETGKQSKGFGFITFKHEKSVSAAVDSHYVTIGGKQVEIKSAVPKCLLCPELQKRSPGQSPRQLEQEQTQQYETHMQTPTKKTTANDMPNKKTTNEGAPERLSWVDTLLNSDPKTCSNEFQMNFSCSSLDKSMPIWFRTFKKWLRLFLEKVSKREGDYALSSLKADFNAECGLELDHVSLGYSKLSDFMRSLSDLCHVKYVATGERGLSNHMVLEPKHPTPYRQPLANCSPSSCTMLFDDNEDCKSSNSKSPQDHVLISDENVDFIGSCIKENLHLEAFKEKSVQKDASPSVPFRFLQFLKPDPIFPAKKWLHNNEANLDLHHSHVILEALARRRNKSSFFTREFDFYKNYKESIGQRKCFGCNQQKILWANFPCQHLLWCGDCKIQVTNLAGLSMHKCVICDKEVEKIDIVPLYAYHQPICHVSSDEFPPLDPDHLRRKKQPVRLADLPSALSFCANRS